ncbi:MAG TPA: sugar nucleotide-binding protein, partial [Saprospiraceae bacterium]|nr:sugar nucleotide-binding protein [Saprospiraceae bacterium]
AKAIRKIIRTLADSPNGEFAGTYHYANEGIINWHGFATEIMQEMGFETKVLPITSAEYRAAAPRPGWSALSLSKIKRVFDIFPPHWRISLKSYLQDLKKNTVNT